MNSQANYDLYNLLIDDLKELTFALEYLEKFESAKDKKAINIAKDSISERVKRIGNRIINNHQMTFPVQDALDFLSDPKFSAKKIHEILDFPMESLRKFALSEILNGSITD